MEKRRYFLGVDPGQETDYCALCMVQQPESNAYVFQVSDLFRFERGVSYVAMVRHIVDLVTKLYEASEVKSSIVLDCTGVGRPIHDLFVDAGLGPVSVIITGGHVQSYDAGYFHVPKLDLIMGLKAGLQTGRFKVAPGLQFGQTFASELLSYRVKVNVETGDESVGTWREGQHDDLLFSAALALWAAARGDRAEGLYSYLRRRDPRNAWPL